MCQIGAVRIRINCCSYSSTAFSSLCFTLVSFLNQCYSVLFKACFGVIEVLSFVCFSVMISSCFVYRSKSLWQKNPVFNRIWLGTSCGMWVNSQFTSNTELTENLLEFLCFFTNALVKLRQPSLLLQVPILSYVWGFLWVFVLLGMYELLRRQEIKWVFILITNVEFKPENLRKPADLLK